MIKHLLLSHRKDRKKEKEREREKESRAVIVIEEQRGRRFKLDIKNRFLL
jgi:hypothetical protein